jgi:hypothetical protein
LPLIGLGIREFEAKRYEGMIKQGRILMSVHCDNSKWTDRAKMPLERTGAQNVSSKGEARAIMQLAISRAFGMAAANCNQSDVLTRD